MYLCGKRDAAQTQELKGWDRGGKSLGSVAVDRGLNDAHTTAKFTQGVGSSLTALP
jgi:hypothetical protein